MGCSSAAPLARVLPRSRWLLTLALVSPRHACQSAACPSPARRPKRVGASSPSAGPAAAAACGAQHHRHLHGWRYPLPPTRSTETFTLNHTLAHALAAHSNLLPLTTRFNCRHYRRGRAQGSRLQEPRESDAAVLLHSHRPRSSVQRGYLVHWQPQPSTLPTRRITAPTASASKLERPTPIEYSKSFEQWRPLGQAPLL